MHIIGTMHYGRSLLLLVLLLTGCAGRYRMTPDAASVYKSRNLVITRISDHSYIHTSYLRTDDFGTVPCNGLVVRDKNEVIVFDTPADDASAQELITWISDSMRCVTRAVIPTHFHDDCLGGLAAFHAAGIPSFAHTTTIGRAREHNKTVPQHGFGNAHRFVVGSQHVIAQLIGEGHTSDNVVGYFPAENILFGGCLIKEVGAGKGNLEDANVGAWPATVKQITKEFPDIKLVVPGHGAYGDTALLNYTIELFSGSEH
ncbi:MAG: Metallo-beta-lactamase type 2 [Chlorobi bacterium]|nr:MAG: Beta-lactamase type II precursor [Chlorobi bacterium OLB6]MBV6464222.1 Metallo-beta-lactamase type 2 [Chlorobiota bacterium]WKZ77369.1 MAG: subclass B1 metallo-beta-lactamase [Candidatus Kapabacteria bacterium]